MDRHASVDSPVDATAAPTVRQPRERHPGERARGRRRRRRRETRRSVLHERSERAELRRVQRGLPSAVVLDDHGQQFPDGLPARHDASVVGVAEGRGWSAVRGRGFAPALLLRSNGSFLFVRFESVSRFETAPPLRGRNC